MKKLFDETNEFDSKYYRTIWYGYVNGNLDEELLNAIVLIVKDDLTHQTCDNAEATHWVFYGEATCEDAIGDTVRPSLMIREKRGVFVTNYNISDFDFVSAFDMISEFKLVLEATLNA